MAFCTKCGKELRDGDKFCFYCGEPVRGDNAGENHSEKKDSGQETGGSTDYENKDRGKFGNDKRLIGVIIAAVLVLVVLFFLVRGGKESVPEQKENDTEYTSYSNAAVCFSLDYPEGYMVTEPEDNNVLITNDGEADFQVSAEYAFHTTTNSFIYSAKDFAEQIENDEGVLTAWIGAPDIEVTDTKTGKLGGRECYQYDFTLEMEGDPNTGRLYLIEGDGQFGCYSLMSVINENAKDAKVFKEQRDAIEKSFQVTGAHQPEGYSMHQYDGLKTQTVIRDSVLEKTEESNSRIVVYPVKGEYSKANIWISASTYDSGERDAKEILEKECEFVLEHEDNAKLISQPSEIDGGRYPMMGATFEFYDKGDKFTATEIVVDRGGEYWNVEMEALDEYLEAASGALSDVLASLRFTDGTETGTKSMVSGIIKEIEDRSDYVSESYWKPLAAADDFNGDGVQEFLAVYEVKDGAGINVVYDLWSLKESGAQKLKSEVLFKEVGGNNGIVGIVNPGSGPLLAVYRYEPEGETFNCYYTYFSWEKDKSALGDSGYYLECHGNYEQEEKGRYILGDTSVEKSKFDAKYKELTQWTYRLDLLGGGGDGAKTFDEMK